MVLTFIYTSIAMAIRAAAALFDAAIARLPGMVLFTLPSREGVSVFRANPFQSREIHALKLKRDTEL